MIDEAYQLRRLYWWGFALRFLLGVGGWLLMQLLEIPLLQDAMYYEEVGASIAREWLNGRPSAWLATEGLQPDKPVLMITVIACFYVLTLGVRAFPVLMAFYSAITAFTPLLVYRISRQIGASSSAALVGGWLVAISPAFVFWCGALYKEGLVLLFLSLAIHHALRLQVTWQTRSFCILSLSLLGMVTLRLYVALIMAVTICLGLLLGREGRSRRGVASPSAVKQAPVVMLFALIVAGVGLDAYSREALPFTLEDILVQIQSSRNDLASTPSGYLRDASVATSEDAVRFCPLGLAYFLTVPLPWQTGSLRQNLAIPDTAVWLALYPVILIGMVSAWRRNFQGSALLITASVALCLLYALCIGNIGTAYRLRVQVWLLWAPFVAIGYDVLRPRRTISSGLPGGGRVWPPHIPPTAMGGYGIRTCPPSRRGLCAT